MVRNVLGSLIALVGATAAVWSPFRAWYDGRHGSAIRIDDLFNGITDNKAELFGSLFLPMAFAGLLTLLGLALRSRLLVGLAGVVALGFTVLWMVRQGQAAGSLTAGGDGLGLGVAGAVGGGVLLLLGALVMRGRGGRGDRGGRREPGFSEPEPFAPTAPEPWDSGRPAAQEWRPGPGQGPGGGAAGPDPSAPWPDSGQPDQSPAPGKSGEPRP